MTNAHTPGPWATGEDGDIFAHQGRHCVAEMPFTFDREANARLIASAPDLLRVLTMYLNVDDDGDGFICAEAMDDVRAVIARATGEA